MRERVFKRLLMFLANRSDMIAICKTDKKNYVVAHGEGTLLKALMAATMHKESQLRDFYFDAIAEYLDKYETEKKAFLELLDKLGKK